MLLLIGRILVEKLGGWNTFILNALRRGLVVLGWKLVVVVLGDPLWKSLVSWKTLLAITMRLTIVCRLGRELLELILCWINR